MRVVLRNFAAQMDSRESGPSGDLLWNYVKRQMGQNLADFGPLLRRHLLEEGGILILDGLDEVPESQHGREMVKEAILGFRRQFPRVRILLTSRTYAYERQLWRMPNFGEAVLAPFTPEQIQAFVDGWYAHMSSVRSNMTEQDAHGRASLLKAAIQGSSYLRELAARPLLLTLMASLHAWRGGSLPEQREELYEESVDLLLDIWDRPKIVHDRTGTPVVQVESAAEWFRAPQQKIREALERLAFDVHRTQEERSGSADIAETKLVSALLRAAAPDTKQARVIEYIRDRAGLLTNRGQGIYSFPHRTFQEYLAARHLTRSNFPKQLVTLVRDDVERWREVLLLAGAKVARGTPYAAWSLVERLCPELDDGESCNAAAQCDWWSALLAGQLLTETGIYHAEDLDVHEVHALNRVVNGLIHLVGGGHLPPVDRVRAGVALGILGDPRAGVGVKNGLPEIDWVEVEVGPFTMGSRQGEAPWEDETPVFTCHLIREPYRISRYPITVTQYRAFVDGGGYAEEQWWTEAGWEWRQHKKIAGPHAFAEVFQTPNHPQVGVSWYEAVAFCNWLSGQLGYEVRLPGEAQWERAARHTDGRKYPWGNDGLPKDFCNMADTGIGSPSAVGMFPLGNAECGAADMAGNVLEWCTTRWLENYESYEQQVDDTLEGRKPRVLRGGAFYNSRRLVRCACRLRYDPDSRFYCVGFRVVLSPFFSEL